MKLAWLPIRMVGAMRSPCSPDRTGEHRGNLPSTKQSALSPPWPSSRFAEHEPDATRLWGSLRMYAAIRIARTGQLARCVIAVRDAAPRIVAPGLFATVGGKQTAQIARPVMGDGVGVALLPAWVKLFTRLAAS